MQESFLYGVCMFSMCLFVWVSPTIQKHVVKLIEDATLSEGVIVFVCN